MKKARIGALLTALIIFALFSCDDQFLTRPNVPGDGDSVSGRSVALDGITASHGEKGSISLTWNENSNATLYYIYKADSPLNSFYRIAETTNTQYKFTVNPGTTAYYRVSFVSYEGSESPQSTYVMGTSLAQPIISDIVDKNESEVTVIWYMENVSDDTYKANLLYTVYCFNFNSSTEVAQIALDGATLTENKATFRNLSANTSYEYQVEAYLRSDQSASEKSDKMDAATARRMRPGAPVNLRASRGTSADKIELHFELPDMVDIALGDNQFEPKPIYFVISKRRYSASGNNAYQPYCLYYGSISAKAAAAEGGKTFSGYSPGTTVSWTDNISKDYRGIEYEYQVQSYVDDTQKIITADSSKASATGWALNNGTLNFGDIGYTLNELGTQYASAQQPLDFDFDPKGVIYDYLLVETIEPIDLPGQNSYDPDGTVTRTSDPLTYNEIKNHVVSMNLTQKTTNTTPGRGVYSYAVKINLNNDTIDTFSTIGKVEVSEDTDPIIVEGFSVQDGYTDKFVLKWHNYENRKYELYESNTGYGSDWTPISGGVVNPNPVDTSTVKNENHSYTYTTGITPGLTKHFAIKPYRDIGGGNLKGGQMVYASSYQNAGFKTLGVPELLLGGDASYGTITATWTPAQKADTYRIRYWYTEGTETGTPKIKATVKASDLSEVGNRLVYRFSPFENNAIDAANAGLEIQVEVDALNVDLQTKVGGGEIATTSKETVKKRLVGPSKLNPSVSEAASPQQINVSWDKITGANGYYVFRRQFNMNNTAVEEPEAIVYYVPATDTPSIEVTGKNLMVVSNEKTDTKTVKAAASFAGSRYTLTDIYMPDNEYNGSGHTLSYRKQQNDMAQGFSYRYYIVPVVDRSGSPEPLTSINFVYSGANISYYTIRENNVDIRYNGAPSFEKAGFTIGFGQNVTASKGTYASSGNVNNGIQITWSAPPRLAGVAGFSPRYTVYRRAHGSPQWDTIITNQTVLQYPDISPAHGITYEYVVGIANGSGAGSAPKDSSRYINHCGTLRDEKERPKFLGYMLGNVRLNSVSRDARTHGNGQFAELLGWQSAGISNSFSSDYNWGIDGYTIYLLNRNVNNARQWITGDDVAVSDLPNQTNQEYLFANNGDNRLKVLRDYRHYFKIRTYVLNSAGEKVYGPDPAPEYLIADGRNDDYVKWGARQISADEFAAITALSIGTALNWSGNSTSDVPDRNWNGSHNVSKSESNIGYNRDLNFNNSKPYFVNVYGHIYGHCNATAMTPTRYGADCDGILGAISPSKAHESTLTITGPGDVNGMYSGSVTIRLLDSGSNRGPYKVSYNGQNAYEVEYRHYRECFTFSVMTQDYKRTRNFDWSPSAGITGTGNVGPNMADKWWYPINGNRAGWD